MQKVKAHSKYTFLSGLFLSATLLLNAHHSIAASLYNITDIGFINLQGNDYQNLQIKVNDNNHVVGWYKSNNKLTGFFWNATEGLTTLVTTTLEHSFLDKNISNDTVGFIKNSNGSQTAIIWDATYTTTINLGSLGGTSSQANAINASNQVVGNSEDNNGIIQPFVWSNGSMSIVPINNTSGGTADTINNNGWIGGSTFINQFSQAYLWDNIDISILNTINTDVSSSWITDINNLNEAVGGMQIFRIADSTNPQDLRTRAFSWNKTNGHKDLGENIQGISWATAINDNQQIVGGRRLGFDNRQAILWEDTSAFNLNKLTLNLDNWTLISTTDINTSGNIVGIGKRAGLYHAFLLEPSSGTATTSDLEISLATSTTNNKARAINIASNTTLKFIVTNHGPSDATNIRAESLLDDLLTVSNLNISKGNCTTDNQTINCEISSLALNESVELSFKLSAEETKDYQIHAQVTAEEVDAGLNLNNSISETLKITAKATTQESALPEDNTQTEPENANNDTKTTVATGSFNPLFILFLFVAFLTISRTSTIIKH